MRRWGIAGELSRARRLTGEKDQSAKWSGRRRVDGVSRYWTGERRREAGVLRPLDKSGRLMDAAEQGQEALLAYENQTDQCCHQRVTRCRT